MIIHWERDADWCYNEFWHKDRVQFQFGKILVGWDFIFKEKK